MTDLQNRSIVDNEVDFFMDEFNTFDVASNWDLIATGAGMAITVPGTTTKYLNINSGVNINSETIIRSRRRFQQPLRLLYGLSMSQRIANTEVFVELVGVDPVNRLPEADAAGGNANGALNVVSWKFDNVTATSALALIRGQSLPEVLSGALTVGTTIATGTGPNFLPASVYEIRLDYESAFHGSKAINTASVVATHQRRDDILPEMNKEYKIQIRVKNLGVAPASATDIRLHFVRMLDFTRLLTQAIGSTDGAQATSVLISGAPTVQGNTAEDAVASGNPVTTAGVARTALPAATVVNGDVLRLTLAQNGALIEKPYSLPDLDWQFASPAGGIINSTAVAVRAAQAAGIRNYVTAMQLRNTNAVATEFVILDGATIIWRGQLPANMAGAEDFNFPTPLRGTAATAINVQCLTTGAAVYANLQGYSAY